MPDVAYSRDVVDRALRAQRSLRKLETYAFGREPSYLSNQDHPHPIAEWLAFPSVVTGFTMGEAAGRLWAAEAINESRELHRLIRVLRLRTGAIPYFAKTLSDSFDGGALCSPAPYITRTDGYTDTVGIEEAYPSIRGMAHTCFYYVGDFKHFVTLPVPDRSAFVTYRWTASPYGRTWTGTFHKLGKGPPLCSPTGGSPVALDSAWPSTVINGNSPSKPGFTIGYAGSGFNESWYGDTTGIFAPGGYTQTANQHNGFRSTKFPPQNRGAYTQRVEPIELLMGPGEWTDDQPDSQRVVLPWFDTGVMLGTYYNDTVGITATNSFILEEDLKVKRAPIPSWQGSKEPGYTAAYVAGYGRNPTAADNAYLPPQTWAQVAGAYAAALDAADMAPLKAWVLENLGESITLYDHGWVSQSSLSMFGSPPQSWYSKLRMRAKFGHNQVQLKGVLPTDYQIYSCSFAGATGAPADAPGASGRMVVPLVTGGTGLLSYNAGANGLSLVSPPLGAILDGITIPVL